MSSISNNSDTSCRFLFENTDCRGEFVRLNDAYSEVLDIHQYAPVVAELLGEFLAAAVLLSTTIKFEGRLILQAQSDAAIPLLMAECDSNFKVRAIARGAEQVTAGAFSDLFSGGRLAITIEPVKGQRYQGIVALQGGSLAACIEAYFDNSEQLPTRLWLASDGLCAAGLLLQQLPEQVTLDARERSEQWAHLCTLADTVTKPELLQVERNQLLLRLFHEDPLRLFASHAVAFSCSCSRQRCLAAIHTLNPEDVEEMLVEDGGISMDCEFCNQQYRFNRADVEGQANPESHSFH